MEILGSGLDVDTGLMMGLAIWSVAGMLLVSLRPPHRTAFSGDCFRAIAEH